MDHRQRVVEILQELLRGPVDEVTVFQVTDTLIHLMIMLGMPRDAAIAGFMQLVSAHFWVPPQEIGGFAMILDAESGQPIANPHAFEAPNALRAAFEMQAGKTHDDEVARRIFEQVFKKEDG